MLVTVCADIHTRLTPSRLSCTLPLQCGNPPLASAGGASPGQTATPRSSIGGALPAGGGGGLAAALARLRRQAAALVPGLPLAEALQSLGILEVRCCIAGRVTIQLILFVQCMRVQRSRYFLRNAAVALH